MPDQSSPDDDATNARHKDVDSAEARVPLILDIDGSLVSSDFLYDCLVQTVKRKPWLVFAVVLWAMKGRAFLKHRLYQFGGHHVSEEYLPYRSEALDLIEQARAAGTPVYLASGSHQEYVDRVGAYLKLSGPHLGTSKETNLTSSNKAAVLQARFPDGFDYLGNSSADLPVWQAARHGYAVGISPALASKVSTDPKMEILGGTRRLFRPLLKSMRLHQWAKNLLIFVIFAITYPQGTPQDLVRVIIGFFLLGALASSTYMLNDLMDVEADRQHATKRQRPFASGALPVPLGLSVAIGLFVASLVAAYFLSPAFCLVLLVYAGLTLSYSLLLKRFALIDVFCLTMLFCLRVVAGGAIIAIAPSPWLLVFMFFFFLSLGLAKRLIEVDHYRARMPQTSWKNKVPGRDYALNDRDFLAVAGIGTAALALTVFFIYALMADLSLFKTPWHAIAAGFFLTFWLMRIWFLAMRNEVDDDPISFAIKDPTSVVLGLALFVLVLV